MEVRYVDGAVHMSDDGEPARITAQLLEAIRRGECEAAVIEADVLTLTAVNGQWRYRIREYDLPSDGYDLELIDRAVSA